MNVNIPMIIIFIISFTVNIPCLYKNTNHIHIKINSTKTIILILTYYSILSTYHDYVNIPMIFVFICQQINMIEILIYRNNKQISTYNDFVDIPSFIFFYHLLCQHNNDIHIHNIIFCQQIKINKDNINMSIPGELIDTDIP